MKVEKNNMVRMECGVLGGGGDVVRIEYMKVGRLKPRQASDLVFQCMKGGRQAGLTYLKNNVSGVTMAK